MKAIKIFYNAKHINNNKREIMIAESSGTAAMNLIKDITIPHYPAPKNKFK